MARKSTSTNSSSGSNAVATTATASKGKKSKASATQSVVAAAAAEEEAPQLPLVLRIVIIGVTSYVAEKIWTNRRVVSEVWFAGDRTETELKMITAFEYFGATGMLFVVGIAVGVAMTKAAAYFPKL